MSTTRNQDTATRIIESVFGGGELELVDELFANDFAGHAPPARVEGPEEMKARVAGFREAFPDLAFEVEDAVDEGDYVTTSWVARGTHEGEFHGIPPTGVEIEMPGVTLYRFEDERVAEGWTHRDASDVLRQLGVGEESA